MSVTEVLFSPRMLIALSLYLAFSIGLTVADGLLAQRIPRGVYLWLWEHLYLPMFRAVVLMSFILLAYPVLFGLHEAPALADLLSAEDGRVSRLLGLVFLLSLVLPLLPALGTIPALILPLQGIAGAALLFNWVCRARGIAEVSYLPDWQALMAMVSLAAGTYWLAQNTLLVTDWLGREFLETADLDELIGEGLTLLLQAPVIIVYGLSLGSQLPAS